MVLATNFSSTSWWEVWVPLPLLEPKALFKVGLFNWHLQRHWILNWTSMHGKLLKTSAEAQLGW